MSKEDDIKAKFASIQRKEIIDKVVNHYVDNIVSSCLKEEKAKLSAKKLN